MYGVDLDFSKAFDNVPIKITLDLLRRLGLGNKILRPLTFMYDSLQRYLKIRGCIGLPFKATNGVMQGCPLSCLLLNALVSIFTRSVREEVDVINQSYVDDITLLSRNLGDLQSAMDILQPYLDLTMQKLNVSKTYTFAVNDDGCKLMCQGKELPNSNEVKILGVKFKFNECGVTFEYKDSDLKIIEPALTRIKNSNLPFWARTLVIGGAIISKICYGSEIRQLSDIQERNIKNMITGAVWGSGTRKRTPGVLYTIITKGHVLDITQATLVVLFVMTHI